jgi:hypothetical protein
MPAPVRKVTRQKAAHTMETVFEECRALRAAGQKEYAHLEENALRNFESCGEDLDISPEKSLWVLAKKHIDGITGWIKGHRSQRESVKGRINDLIVYLCLLRCMVDQIEENEPITVEDLAH